LIRIVDPETLTLCLPNEVGEIWIKGSSVAKGYWNNKAETELIFNARLSGSNEGPFLRTGDLGFFNDGELYITGRIKDLLICDGKNHYSYDIERTVESCHPAIQPTGSAVFSVYHEGPERLIVVAEIRGRPGMNVKEIIKAIRYSVSFNHGLNADDIRLTAPGGIPRTTSGKKRHFLCREYYLKGTLKEIALR
jgi:acyl-CoA synthetase (AMP-forming)/AMP-acid ligase II